MLHFNVFYFTLWNRKLENSRDRMVKNLDMVRRRARCCMEKKSLSDCEEMVQRSSKSGKEKGSKITHRIEGQYWGRLRRSTNSPKAYWRQWISEGGQCPFRETEGSWGEAAGNGLSPTEFWGRIGMISCTRFRNAMEQTECLKTNPMLFKKETANSNN